MPAPERRRPARRPPRRLRCETCGDVVALRHARDVATCGCGALTVSGRPARPTIHWLSRPGGGWTELGCAATRAAPVPVPGTAPRRLGFAAPGRPHREG